MSHSALNPGYITTSARCNLRFSAHCEWGLDTACQSAVSSELRMEDLWSSKRDQKAIFLIEGYQQSSQYKGCCGSAGRDWSGESRSRGLERESGERAEEERV